MLRSWFYVATTLATGIVNKTVTILPANSSHSIGLPETNHTTIVPITWFPVIVQPMSIPFNISSNAYLPTNVQPSARRSVSDLDGELGTPFTPLSAAPVVVLRSEFFHSNNNNNSGHRGKDYEEIANGPTDTGEDIFGIVAGTMLLVIGSYWLYRRWKLIIQHYWRRMMLLVIGSYWLYRRWKLIIQHYWRRMMIVIGGYWRRQREGITDTERPSSTTTRTERVVVDLIDIVDAPQPSSAPTDLTLSDFEQLSHSRASTPLSTEPSSECRRCHQTIPSIREEPTDSSDSSDYGTCMEWRTFTATYEEDRT